MRVLLYRPSFTKYCAIARVHDHSRPSNPSSRPQSPVMDNGLPTSLARQCAVQCVKNACKLISALKKAITESATGAWWYSLFCKSFLLSTSVRYSKLLTWYIDAITCAVIFVLTESTPQLAFHVSSEDIQQAWLDCMEILQQMSLGHSVAGRYIQSLKELKRRGQSMTGNCSPVSFHTVVVSRRNLLTSCYRDSDPSGR